MQTPDEEAAVEAQWFPWSPNLAASLPVCFISLLVYKADNKEIGKQAETTCSLPNLLPEIHTEG